MYYKDFKEIVISEYTKVFEGTGFVPNDHDSGLTFVRKGDDYMDLISTPLYDYGIKHNIFRPLAAKRFNEVEEICSKIIGLSDADKDMTTIHSFDDYDGSMEKELPGPLDYFTKKEEVISSINKIAPYISKFILPFYKKYPSLKEVNEKLQQIEIVDLHKYIGQEVIGRRMIIMKLAGNTGYDEYVNMILNYFKEEADKGDKEAKADLEKYSKLKNYLDSIKA